MKWLKKLNNPFVLGAHGFLAGAVLFFATHPGAAPERGTSTAQQQNVESGRSAA